MKNLATGPRAEDFLDLEFGQSGWLKLARGLQTFNQLRALKPAPGNAGELWVAASRTDAASPRPFSFARLGRTGELAMEWQDDHFVAGQDATCTDIQALPDGRILVVGRSGAPDEPAALAVACYHRDGSLSDAYGQGGRAIIPLSLFAQPGQRVDLALAPQGLRSGIARDVVSSLTRANELLLGFSLRITGGRNDVRSVVVRLTPVGALDRGFGQTGRLTLTLTELGDPTNWLMDIVASPGGAISLLSFHESAHPGFVLARFTCDGERDFSFGHVGAVELRPEQWAPNFRALVADGDERVKISGYWNSSISNPYTATLIGVDRLGFDPSFAGAVGAELPGVSAIWDSCGVEPGINPRFIVAGYAPPPLRLAVARYRSDASLDPEFGGGWLAFARDGMGGVVRCAVMPDRRIIIGVLVGSAVGAPSHVELLSLLPERQL